MTTTTRDLQVLGRADATFSAAEREEMRLLGILDREDRIVVRPGPPAQVPRRVISAHDVLNEATDYALPSSFSRGFDVPVVAGQRLLLISGTASIDEQGRTVHAGDFRAQLWRTYRNIARLLAAEGATWSDIVRTTCYLRDIERDYDEFNRVRTLFFRAYDVSPVPASTGIQARLCRSDLLVEIEAIAVLAAPKGTPGTEPPGRRDA